MGGQSGRRGGTRGASGGVRRALVVGAGVIALAPAALATPAFVPAPTDVPTTFRIAKSENRNEVHFGVRVDADCRPAGAAPVWAYWRMFEHGGAVEPLLEREAKYYGLAQVELFPPREHGGRLRVRLRALPERPIVIDTRPGDRGCTGVATTEIAGGPAQLRRVFVQLAWPFGVDHIRLEGTRPDGSRVEERLAP